jgi:hypothetical protein
MATRFHLRSRVLAALSAILVSIAIMLWLPLAGSAQDAPNLTVTPVSTAQASTNTVSFLPTPGAGGNTAADVYLVLAFTAVTVLGLVALAILDRTPDSLDRALSGDAVA